MASGLSDVLRLVCLVMCRRIFPMAFLTVRVPLSVCSTVKFGYFFVFRIYLVFLANRTIFSHSPSIRTTKVRKLFVVDEFLRSLAVHPIRNGTPMPDLGEILQPHDIHVHVSSTW